MNYPSKIEELSRKLSQSTDLIEKYELLIELSQLYKRMWKMKKALEISQEALALSRKIIYRALAHQKRLEYEQKGKSKALMF
jgi:hypothetical protein